MCVKKHFMSLMGQQSKKMVVPGTEVFFGILRILRKSFRCSVKNLAADCMTYGVF